MAEKNKTLIILDSNSVIHRAYHALPRLTTEKGELVNAVYGFLLVFLKAINDFNPDFIAAAFDLKAPTFRHKIYQEYKAKRPVMPEDLSRQIPLVKELLKVFNVQIFEKEGFEADDIIGTIASKAGREKVPSGISIIILSGDQDNLQLVNPCTKVYFLRKGVKDVVPYDEKMVAEKFAGITSEQLVDYKALRGDPSDNIPGVTGVGAKTAIRLLLRFGTLENLYKELEENSKKTGELRPKLRETLQNYKSQAFLSKILSQIRKDVKVDFDLEKCRWKNYDKEDVIKIFKNLEFYSLIPKLPQGDDTVKKDYSGGENLRLW